jgi:hypothetical protein
MSKVGSLFHYVFSLTRLQMLVHPLALLLLSLPMFFVFHLQQQKLSISNVVLSHSRYPPTRCVVWTYYIWGHDGSVSKVTALRNGRPKNRGSILGKDEIFLPSRTAPVGGHPVSIQWLPETLPAGGKAAGAWSLPFTLFSAVDKWSLNSTPPYPFTAYTGTYQYFRLPESVLTIQDH